MSEEVNIILNDQLSHWPEIDSKCMQMTTKIKLPHWYSRRVKAMILTIFCAEVGNFVKLKVFCGPELVSPKFSSKAHWEGEGGGEGWHMNLTWLSGHIEWTFIDSCLDILTYWLVLVSRQLWKGTILDFCLNAPPEGFRSQSEQNEAGNCNGIQLLVTYITIQFHFPNLATKLEGRVMLDKIVMGKKTWLFPVRKF